MSQVDLPVLRRKVEAQLLRAARPALRRLAKASRGEPDFRKEDELRACLGLARVAATVLRRNRVRGKPKDNAHDSNVKLIHKLMKEVSRGV